MDYLLHRKLCLLLTIISNGFFLPAYADLSVSEVRLFKPDIHHEFSIVAALGEFEPLVIEIESDENMDDLKVIIQPAIGDVSEYAIDNIDLRWVNQWYQAGGAGKVINRLPGRKLVDELLLKNDELVTVSHDKQKNYIKMANGQYVDVEEIKPDLNERSIDATKYPIEDSERLGAISLNKGQKKKIWITFHIPRTQRPGNYRGHIQFTNRDKIVSSNAYMLEVLPFELGDPVVPHCMYYRGKLELNRSHYLSADWKTKQQLTNEFKNMKDHGISCPTIYQYAERKSELLSYLKIRDDAGLSNDEIFYLGQTLKIATNNAELTKMGSHYLSLKRQLPVNSDIYVYGIDEAKGDDLSRQFSTWHYMRNLGAKVFAAGRKGNASVVGGKLDMFNAAYEPNIDESNAYHLKKTKIFVYANPQVGVEDPSLYRNNYGFPIWKAGYDGAMTYAYQHTEGLSIWNDFDSDKYRDHVFAYPTTTGVIDTVAWEGYREAVDDLRYLGNLLKLKNAINKNDPLYEKISNWLIDFKKSSNDSPGIARNEIIAFLKQGRSYVPSTDSKRSGVGR